MPDKQELATRATLNSDIVSGMVQVQARMVELAAVVVSLLAENREQATERVNTFLDKSDELGEFLNNLISRVENGE